MFTDNIRIKLVALFVAVMLKVYFYSQNNSITAEIIVPLEVRNTSPSMMVVSPLGYERGLFTRVQLEGPISLVQQIERSSNRIGINITPDATEKYVKVFDYDSLAQQLRLPAGVEILKVEPARFEFQLERVLRKELAVMAQSRGTPADGYELKELRVFPQTIRAQGPQSELEGVSQVEAEIIDITDLSQPKRFEVGLREVGRATVLDVNRVSIHAQVIPVQARKEFPRIKVKVVASDGVAATISPSQISVVLSGPQVLLEQLAAEDFEVFVDATGLQSGRHRVAVQTNLPQGISLDVSNPREVDLTVVAKHG